jgi:hypothetical protein
MPVGAATTPFSEPLAADAAGVDGVDSAVWVADVIVGTS